MAWARPSRCRFWKRWCRPSAASANAPRRSAASLRRRLHSKRRDHRPVDSHDGRCRFRAHADPEAARGVQGVAGRRQQPDPRPPGRRGRRPRDQRRRLAERCAGEADQAEDVRGGTTIDQIVARQIGQDTPFPSLELATEDFTGYVGACTSGYSCVYTNTISWSTPTTPLPMEINPRVVVRTAVRTARNRRQRAARMRRNLSILDLISKEASDLQRTLGPRDRERLGEYLDNVREIERRIERAETHGSTEVTSIELPVGSAGLLRRARGPDVRPVDAGVPGRPDARLHVHDAIASSASEPIHRSASTSHTTRSRITETIRRTIAKVIKINTYHVELFARFLAKLRSTPDGDGSLLDHSLIFYGGGMGEREPACERSAAAAGGRRWCRQGQPSHPAAAAHAGWQSMAVGGAPVRQRHRQHWREHGDEWTCSEDQNEQLAISNFFAARDRSVGGELEPRRRGD